MSHLESITAPTSAQAAGALYTLHEAELDLGKRGAQ